MTENFIKCCLRVILTPAYQTFNSELAVKEGLEGWYLFRRGQNLHRITLTKIKTTRTLDTIAVFTYPKLGWLDIIVSDPEI